MLYKNLHEWNVTTQEAFEIQKRLCLQLRSKREFDAIRYIAGANVSLDTAKGIGIAAIVILSFPDLKEVEQSIITTPVKTPYIPGLLSFREAPVLLEAFAKIEKIPDLVIFDGHGFAHPRGLGLASHMGLLLDLPTIGCAKSKLIGDHDEPPLKAGSYVPLIKRLKNDSGEQFEEEVIGAALRTREGASPLYVSIGHRIDLQSAIDIVMKCVDGTRIPKPTREADRLVTGQKEGAQIPDSGNAQ